MDNGGFVCYHVIAVVLNVELEYGHIGINHY